MPNRVIRDWTLSDRIDRLTPFEESFFTRLIMVVDDFGNYPADRRRLKAACFPLKENITSADVDKLFKACEAVGVIKTYQVDGMDFVHIIEFDQKLRRMKNTYPPPVDGEARTSDGQTTDIGRTNDGRNETKRNESESETKALRGQVTDTILEVFPTFDDFWILYDKKVDRPKCEKKWSKLPQKAREAIMFHVEQYVKQTPDKQFRKNPSTYLNNQSWENETITNGRSPKISREQRNEYFRAKGNRHGPSGT